MSSIFTTKFQQHIAVSIASAIIANCSKLSTNSTLISWHYSTILRQ